MAPVTELAYEAVELEAFVDQIPDYQARFNKLQARLLKDGKKVPISNMTTAGGVQRQPLRVPFRAQGGAAIQQFGADTSSSIPMWPRGTGSTNDAFVAAPVRIINTCEISNLTQQATQGKNRGLVMVNKEEMKQSLRSFENGIEGLFNGDGSGTIVAIPATATVSSGSGAGAQTSFISGLTTVAGFSDQQVVQFLPSVGGTTRGTATISFVDPVAQTLYFSTVLPSTGGATAVGDVIVVLGATGAAGSSIFGKNYWIANGSVGFTAGINKALYPGRISTPTINLNNTGGLTNAMAQRIEALISRARGDSDGEDEGTGDKEFYYTNQAQGVSASNNYYNPGVTRLDEGGDTVVDTAKKYMQKTLFGRPVVYSNTCDPTRVDRFKPSDWHVGVLFETRLHEWTPGNTIAPTPAVTAGFTYFDSITFGYECGMQLVCADPKGQFYIQAAPVPQI
jgi:hypothetical protein